MSPETEDTQELSMRQRMAACLLGGLCVGAGINLMVGNEDFAVDVAGVLLTTAGCVGLSLGLIRPEDNETGQQG